MMNYTMPQIESVFGIPARGEGYIVVGSELAPGETPKITVDMTIRKFEEVFGRERNEIGRRELDTFVRKVCGTTSKKIPNIIVSRVIYNPPATIVFFNDGEKIVSKAEDEFDWEVGLAICLLKRAMTSKQYNRMQPYLFAEEPKAKHGKVKWVPLWDVMVRQAYSHGMWEKIKKEWRMK